LLVDLARILKPVARDLFEVERGLQSAFSSGFSPQSVGQVGAHLLGQPGKRIRPALVVLSAGASGYRGERAVIAATAVELLHTASLMHDDVIDAASLRRGAASVNSRWGNTLSVLMGDFILSQVFVQLMDREALDVLRPLLEATYRMSQGEIRETERKGSLSAPPREYYRTIEDKTASLFAAACRIGASLGGKPQSYCDRFESFGKNLGLAFQIVDDVFDYLGTPERLGKPVGSDIREGKVTLPLLHAFRGATPEQRRRMREVLKAKSIQDGGFREIVCFIRQRGGFGYARQKARFFARRAFRELASVPTSPHRTSLQALVEFVVRREK
jgi:octaprenyl-diphosphate synthase